MPSTSPFSTHMDLPYVSSSLDVRMHIREHRLTQTESNLPDSCDRISIAERTELASGFAGKLQRLQNEGLWSPHQRGYIGKFLALQKSGALPRGPIPASVARQQRHIEFTIKAGFISKLRGAQVRARAKLLAPASKEEHESAVRIQKYFRTLREGSQMVNNGAMYKLSARVPERNGKKNINDLTHTNFREILESLSKPHGSDANRIPLSAEERAFAENALNRSMFATHCSDADVINDDGYLELFSRKELLRKKIQFDMTHTEQMDIDQLGNDGHVFFSATAVPI